MSDIQLNVTQTYHSAHWTVIVSVVTSSLGSNLKMGGKIESKKERSVCALITLPSFQFFISVYKPFCLIYCSVHTHSTRLAYFFSLFLTLQLVSLFLSHTSTLAKTKLETCVLRTVCYFLSTSSMRSSEITPGNTQLCTGVLCNVT